MLKAGAKVISYLFHPLMVMSYGLIMLLIINPYMFGFSSPMGGDKLILIVWLSSFLLPAFAALMMKFTGLIPSLELSQDRMTRIGPLIVTSIFYLWLARNFYHNPSIPPIFSAYVMGATISLLIAFFINLFKKISLHGVGMGGWLMLTIFMYKYFDFDSFTLRLGADVYQVGLNYWLFLVLILSGIVGTARLILKAHELDEVSIGFLVGVLGQIIALRLLF
ncbi:MAG TPA: hypothetical protein ENK85_05710 [Saprospiraceae bacterium]|nr:hypothetical protein [Saprospiraceae bacterium]